MAKINETIGRKTLGYIENDLRNEIERKYDAIIRGEETLLNICKDVVKSQEDILRHKFDKDDRMQVYMMSKKVLEMVGDYRAEQGDSFNENKQRVIKLTESQLRDIISESVKNILKEGWAMDSFKGQPSMTRYPSREEWKEFIQGEPDEKEHQYNKLMYNSTKGNKGQNTRNTVDYADAAVWHEPGLKGKLRRTAYGIGSVGNVMVNRAKKALSQKRNNN